ncbi:MAG: hypothetical protein EOO45_25040 [Flavobacterium sp.]|nr:MAG: hypothetical protein EOO45_25040 [Flavobacterium sp.]
MKVKYLFAFAFFALFLSCSEDEGNDTPEDDGLDLVGQEGNPRFNLQFTRDEEIDLDLYVITPGGETIYYSNRNADGGQLDVDCLCSSCPQGPNENIFWEDGTAPSGTYTYYVRHYSACGSTDTSSDFTLRVIKNGNVIATKTGTLSAVGSETQHWTHTQP